MYELIYWDELSSARLAEGAHSQESWWAASYHPEQFRQSYIDNIVEIQKVFYENNLEYNFVNLRNLKNKYKLLIVPGHIVLEEGAADAIRRFAEAGGTVVMTGLCRGGI